MKFCVKNKLLSLGGSSTVKDESGNDIFKVKGKIFSLTKKKKTLKTKKKYTYKAKGYGIKASSIKWSSSNKSVLSISKKGKAVAKKPGKATVTAKYKKIKATVKVTVKKK